jgi:hypothetical protein
MDGSIDTMIRGCDWYSTPCHVTTRERNLEDTAQADKDAPSSTVGLEQHDNQGPAEFGHQIHYAEFLIPDTLKYRHIYEVLNIDEIKKLIAQFCCTCETNILSLTNQCLDNYYQIKTKLLQCNRTLTMQSLVSNFGI